MQGACWLSGGWRREEGNRVSLADDAKECYQLPVNDGTNCGVPNVASASLDKVHTGWSKISVNPE
jgi:hypothetical protein